MTPKQYLTEVARAERDLRTLKARIAHFEDLGLSITANTSSTHIKPSMPSSRVESAAVGIVDAVRELNAKLRADTVTGSESE